MIVSETLFGIDIVGDKCVEVWGVCVCEREGGEINKLQKLRSPVSEAFSYGIRHIPL